MQLEEKVINGFRLSPQQKHLWYLQKANSAYCVQGAISLEGNINIEILQAALEKLINRHEILRTKFIRPKGIATPLQVIVDESKFVWHEVNLNSWDTQQQKSQINSLFEQERLQFLQLEQGSLLQAYLISLSATKRILLLTISALCADACSLQNLIKEIAYFYQGEELEEVVQYVQFSEWQNQLLEDNELADENYWNQQDFSNLPHVKLPFTSKSLVDSESFTVNSVECKISQSAMSTTGYAYAKIKKLTQQYSTETSTFWLACWLVLLWRFTQQPNMIIGKGYNGRQYQELETAIGLFAKYLPLQCSLQTDYKFSDILMQVAQGTQDISQWQEYFTWEKLAELSWFPFSFDFQEQSIKYSAGEVSFSLYQQYVCTERFNVKLSIQQEDTLLAALHYDANLFKAEDMQRFARHLQTLVESAIANPELSISQLDILTECDRQQLLYEFNNTKTDFPQDKLIHQLFEVQVKSTPNNIAVVFEQQQLTYTELNCRANQIAHYLQQQGVKPETIVAICMERSLEAIVAILGILKAGGAYLPLDPSFPTSNLIGRLQDAQVQILLTNSTIQQQHPALSVSIVLYLDTDEKEITSQSHDNLLSNVTGENLAYTIYTSGSTGKPKGVAIEHRQILNYLHSIQQILDLPINASFALVSTLAADLGNTVIFPALCSGGCLHIISTERATNGQALADYCRQHQIDCLKIVPSHLEALLTDSAQDLLPKARLILGGEACNWELIKKIQQFASDCKIFNHYGPTETTVGVLTYQIEQIDLNSQTVPLGKAIANTQVYVLDSQLQPVPIGVSGELYIGGDCLARGYLNQPELTAERFISHPFSQQQEAKLYKTGDLVRYQADGNLEFLGRIDNQVKIRGFRIELGEIEVVLCQHPSIQQAVVLLREDETGNQRLVAYIVPRKDISTTIQDWRSFLRKKLPEYMLPSVFFRLKTLPLTPNGKVDRQALPNPDFLNSKSENSFVAPREGLELQLKHIWEELLQVRPIGVKDNFFDIGGHSLLAVRLVAQIEKHFQRKIALSDLLQEPTIEHLAAILRQQPESKSWLPLVPIQPLGSKKPFFCVHPSGGNVICYYNLASHLGREQPLYGFESPGFYGECEPYYRIEDMASFYIQALRSIQPQDPYLLGGWSMGGLIALEMAIQLQQQGQKVALLALLDTKPPIVIDKFQNNKVDDAQLLADIAIATAKFFGKDLLISEVTLREVKPEKQLNYVLDMMKQANFVPPDIGLQQIRAYLQVTKSHKRALMDYVAKFYPGQITLFQAEQQLSIDKNEEISANIIEPNLDWSHFSSQPLNVHVIPGEHGTILAEPNVKVLAEKLKHCLDKT